MPDLAQPEPTASWHRWLVLAVVLAGASMAVVDVTIVNVAVPSIRADLNASIGQVEFVIAGYTISYASLLIIGGRLGDLYGRRRMIMLGMAVFTLASAGCGLAPSMPALIAGRVVQGVGAALLYPQVLATVLTTFAGPDRARALGVFGSVVGASAIAGQVIGGLLLSADLFGATWRPAFLVNVPLGILGVCAAAVVLPRDRPAGRAHLDLAGAALAATTMVLVVVPLLLGRDLGWPPELLACLPAAALTGWGFHRHERRVAATGGDPLLHPALLRHRSLSAGIPVVMLFAASYAGFLLVIALHLQVGLGFSPLHAALVYTPAAAGFFAASLTAPHLVARYGRRLVLTGHLVTAAGLAATAASALAAGTGLHGWELTAPLVVSGLGQGLALSPLIGTMVSGLPPAEAGGASGVLTSTLQIGNVLGVAGIGLIFAAVSGRSGSPAAFAAALAVAAAFPLLGGVLLHRLDAVPHRSLLLERLPGWPSRVALALFLTHGGRVGESHLTHLHVYHPRASDRP